MVCSDDIFKSYTILYYCLELVPSNIIASIRGIRFFFFFFEFKIIYHPKRIVYYYYSVETRNEHFLMVNATK